MERRSTLRVSREGRSRWRRGDEERDGQRGDDRMSLNTLPHLADRPRRPGNWQSHRHLPRDDPLRHPASHPGRPRHIQDIPNHHPCAAPAVARQLPPTRRGQPQGHCASDRLGERQVVDRRHGRGDLRGELPQLVRGRGAPLERDDHPLQSPRHEELHRQAASGCLRAARPVELPRGDDCEEDRSGACDGMYRRDQGALGNALHQPRHHGGEWRALVVSSCRCC
jgi:hypothetical protein